MTGTVTAKMAATAGDTVMVYPGRYTDREGVSRLTFVIDVDEFMFLGEPGQRAHGAAADARALDEADLADLDDVV